MVKWGPGKTRGHAETITGVIERVKHRFSPKISMIKKAIERLIEREYIERREMEDGKPGYYYIN
jgi:predicted transcriptional regulator